MRTAFVALKRIVTVMALNGGLEVLLSLIEKTKLYLFFLFKLNEECDQFIQ